LTNKTEITYGNNWYNIRSRKPISTAKLWQLNNIIGDIGFLHYGLKWIYVVDNKENSELFDIILNDNNSSPIAQGLKLHELKPHLETILNTVRLYRQKLTLDKNWIISKLSRDEVSQIYKRKYGENGSLTYNKEKELVASVADDLKWIHENLTGHKND
jgi:hypothetical protein